MGKLTRAQRERIIIASLKGQETPGYEVIHNDDDSYTVHEKSIIIKSESEDDSPEEVDAQDDKQEEIVPIEPPRKTKHKGKYIGIRNKQNARQLLQQLSELMESDDDYDDTSDVQDQPVEFYQPRYQVPQIHYNRRRLRL